MCSKCFDLNILHFVKLLVRNKSFHNFITMLALFSNAYLKFPIRNQSILFVSRQLFPEYIPFFIVLWDFICSNRKVNLSITLLFCVLLLRIWESLTPPKCNTYLEPRNLKVLDTLQCNDTILEPFGETQKSPMGPFEWVSMFAANSE